MVCQGGSRKNVRTLAFKEAIINAKPDDQEQSKKRINAIMDRMNDHLKLAEPEIIDKKKETRIMNIREGAKLGKRAVKIVVKGNLHNVRCG
jgi:hypothetical protein